MRELDLPPSDDSIDRLRVAVIGAGRLGRALVPALTAAGVRVQGAFGRDASVDGFDVVLLCVPDGEIAAAAATVSPPAFVGHTSGATGLGALAGHEAFSLHPLMTVTPRGAVFAGAGAAVAGSTPAALRLARALAVRLGMEPFEVLAADRAAYHAAASIASNFLVTLEVAAERLALTAGVQKRMLVPLVRAAVSNWSELEGAEALTGPVARGDRATITRQREAVAQRLPELVALFDELVLATGELAGNTATSAGAP
jgi:predicted short-subunit dehydrogenase-like oxidoreductase (DUF2520 family)